MTQFRIKNLSSGLYWNDLDGWTRAEKGDLFSREEQASGFFKLPQHAVWEPIPEPEFNFESLISRALQSGLTDTDKHRLDLGSQLAHPIMDLFQDFWTKHKDQEDFSIEDSVKMLAIVTGVLTRNLTDLTGNKEKDQIRLLSNLSSSIAAMVDAAFGAQK